MDAINLIVNFLFCHSFFLSQSFKVSLYVFHKFLAVKKKKKKKIFIHSCILEENVSLPLFLKVFLLVRRGSCIGPWTNLCVFEDDELYSLDLIFLVSRPNINLIIIFIYFLYSTSFFSPHTSSKCEKIWIQNRPMKDIT